MKQVERSLHSQTVQTGDGSQTEQWSVSRVEPSELPLVWPHLEEQIRRSLTKASGDTISERELANGVTEGRIDLWVIHSKAEILAGLFLRIDKRDRGKALCVLDVVAGSGKGFRDYAEWILPRLREYGDMIGAYTVESYSRPGAARHLMRLGCKPKAYVMELRD